MAEKKKTAAKPAVSGRTSASKRGDKAIESKTGAGAALAARSKDARPAKTTESKPARVKKTATASKAAAQVAKPTEKTTRSKSTEEPSIAKRVLRKVKSAAGGVASLAGSVVGRH